MENYEELYQWVETHPITRPKRNINRDFSDAMPLVEILKYHFPKLVQLHNYAPRNSYAHKIVNWQTLNNKVLKRLKLNLSMSRIEQLAKGETGCIEQLLMEIRQKIDKMKTEEALNTTEEPERIIDMKAIPVEEFEQMENDLKEKSETITILQNKLERLTGLLNTKDERIRELTTQLETLALLTEKMNQKQNSRFFGLF